MADKVSSFSGLSWHKSNKSSKKQVTWFDDHRFTFTLGTIFPERLTSYHAVANFSEDSARVLSKCGFYGGMPVLYSHICQSVSFTLALPLKWTLKNARNSSDVTVLDANLAMYAWKNFSTQEILPFVLTYKVD